MTPKYNRRFAEDMLESVACPLDGAEDADLLRTVNGLSYVKCRQCGLLYVTPRPTPAALQSVYAKPTLQAMFKSWTYRFRKMSGLKNIEERLHRGTLLFGEVEQGRSSGRLLDIGCNRGFILAAAADRGWDAHGVEIVPWMPLLVEREYGATIYRCRLREIDPPLPDAYFDAITMIDVIEHLHDPVWDLREVHRLLKPDGDLLINTPDVDSAYARDMGPDWLLMKPEEHLYLFCRETLGTLFAMTGFDITGINSGKGGPGEFEVHARKSAGAVNRGKALTPEDIT